jgi:CDP-glucose 4,6-dehydratase
MTFWNGKKVFITGPSGLIGGYLCKRLLELGADITGFDLNGKGTLAWHGIYGTFPIVSGDVRNLPILQENIKKAEFVFHLAANSGVESTRNGGMAAIDVNVRGTYTVLEACRNAPNLLCCLVASSNHIYGEQSEFPVPESARLKQLDTYSVSKICADYLTRAYHYNYGVPTAVVRNTNCFGAYDPHDDHIIQGTILSLLDGEVPVIFGSGKTKKSYLHTSDIVEAYLRIAEACDLDNRKGEAWNVSGESIGVLDLVNLIIKTVSHAVNTIHPIVLGRASNQSDEGMDSSKVRALGWAPKYTLTQGIADTANWLEKQRNGEIEPRRRLRKE